MKSRFGRSTILLLLSLLARPAVRTSAQVVVPPLDKITSQAELDKAISALDTQLFDAYNHCDLAKFAGLLDENVEFYHDQGGVTLGREKLTEHQEQHLHRGYAARAGIRDAEDLLHEGLWGHRNGRASVSAPQDRSRERNR